MKPALLILVLTILAACQTVEGAGQDISNAGDAITDASKEAQ